MNCQNCGTAIPPGAAFCPNCGTTIRAATESTVRDPNLASIPYSAVQSPPSDGYASPPYPPTPPAPTPYTYGAPPSPSYSPPGPSGYPPYPPYAPYNATPPAAPPSPPRGSRRIGLIIGAVLLALLVIAGSVFVVFLRPGARSNTPQVTPTVNATTTARINATATAVALQNPYTNTGTLAFTDPLSDNSKGRNWDTNGTNCAFTGGTYHVIAPNANFIDYCLAEATDFSNLAFEAQMQVIKGYAGGLTFRVTSTNPTNEYYQFDITQDGLYAFIRVIGNTGSDLKVVMSGNSPAIHKGLNATNLIAVVAQGASFKLYVNHQLITSVTDSTYSHGRIGMIALPNNKPTEVAFSNLRVWTL